MSLPYDSRKIQDPQIALRFEQDPAGHTFVARQFVTYPFVFTKPFYLDRFPDGMLTLILQSISGGIYEHDQLGLSLTAGVDSQVHLTTQGATVVHSMPHNGEAHHRVRIYAAKGTFVEYLPDPMILFPTARLKTEVHVTAEEGSTVIVGDAFLSHDPRGMEQPFGSLFSETLFRRPEGPPLCIDRFMISGYDMAAALPNTLRHYAAQGTFWVFSDQSGDDLVASLRNALDEIPDLYAGASTLPGNSGAWTRLLAADAVALKKGFYAAWSSLRRLLAGEEPASHRKPGWL